MMLFPFKYDRSKNAINRLWTFFIASTNDSITDEMFSDILTIKGTGKTKITEVLFYVNPDKYFPINSPTKPLLKEKFGIDPKFNSYSDYMEILNKVKQQSDKSFYQLSYESWSLISNYWIFQGNPKIYDIVGALQEDMISTWSVKSHKEKIKLGDKIILWVTGENPGCYALAEVTSDVYHGIDDENQMRFYTDKSKNNKSDRVRIKVTNNFTENPITKDQIDLIPKLSKLKVGSQGTNFSSTKEEYEEVLKLSDETNVTFSSTCERFSKSQLDHYFVFLQEIINHFSLESDDQRIVFTCRKYSLNFTVGQRYCWNIFFTEHGVKYGVISKDKFDDTSSTFDGRKPVPFYTRVENTGFTKKEKETILIAVAAELNRTKKSSFRKHNNLEFENEAFKKLQNKQSEMNIPLNLILYGAPGTGKTYKLKNEFFELFTDQQGTQTRAEFNIEITKNLAWWEVISIVLLDVKKAKVIEIFNHPLLQAKNSISENKTPKNTIWSWLQRHTKDECSYVKFTKRDSPQFLWKDEKGIWTIDEEIVKSDTPDFYDILKEYHEFKPVTKTIKRYHFITFHQSYSYEDFIEGIKPNVFDNEANPEQGKTVIYEIKDGIFKQLVKKALNDPGNNYALFIDEINRGNIANIFGELITLIEQDKRVGADNYIPAQLPYSGEEFGVPQNLFIIGTMNTADRSVEALDTALRRRFSFMEINPEPEKLAQTEFLCKDIDLSKLLTAINSRIEKLLDKDYCIGHSYFMTIKDRQNPLSELKDVFQNKILPLLQEYFYGDWGKIMLVLGEKFVLKASDVIEFKATDKYENFDEYNERPSYRFTSSSDWTIDTFKSIYE
ncbi:MAG: EVE domain-containing protein [Bacteroidetes bacterium]|nr:EVE domain-containing protein [Bacteroidota bacterium]MBT7996848.1 EVE domain-containing protein [Bacteroidota bacterium]